MNLNRPLENEDRSIWTPVVRLLSGEVIKRAALLTFEEANQAADLDAKNLIARGFSVDWNGARRVA